MVGKKKQENGTKRDCQQNCIEALFSCGCQQQEKNKKLVDQVKWKSGIVHKKRENSLWEDEVSNKIVVPSGPLCPWSVQHLPAKEVCPTEGHVIVRISSLQVRDGTTMEYLKQNRTSLCLS